MAERDGARDRMREFLWADRMCQTEYLIMHSCELRQFTRDLILLAGWSPDAFVMADLVSDRSLLDD